jgi:hypothetical protein
VAAVTKIRFAVPKQEKSVEMGIAGMKVSFWRWRIM